MKQELDIIKSGEYCNPKLEKYMRDMLHYCMMRGDLAPYMCVRKLSEAIITDCENEYSVQDDLGL